MTNIKKTYFQPKEEILEENDEFSFLVWLTKDTCIEYFELIHNVDLSENDILELKWDDIEEPTFMTTYEELYSWSKEFLKNDEQEILNMGAETIKVSKNNDNIDLLIYNDSPCYNEILLNNIIPIKYVA